MIQLKNPPTPKNKNWMVFVAFLIFGLAALVVVLTDEVIEKPGRDSEVKKQISTLEHQIAQKEKNAENFARVQVDKANQFDPEMNVVSETTDALPSAKFLKQENKMGKGTIDEPDYLKDRAWGFWYIVFPLFIVTAIFIFWVWKKHRKWTR